MSLRPDLEMYETDGNLEPIPGSGLRFEANSDLKPVVGRITFGSAVAPIRHPEAQHMLAAMDEHKRQQEQLMALWRAAWNFVYNGQHVSTAEAFEFAVEDLGPPPHAAPDKP